jgi:Helix-turn-helix.
MKHIHIGSIIKQKVEESSLTVREFADRINCERTTAYHIFRQKSIDIEKLMKISEVLNYDFISEVYKKTDTKTIQPTQTIFIAVEVEVDSLQQLALPNDFIQLLKK